MCAVRIRRARSVVGLSILLLTTSCAVRHVAFRPRENVDAESPQGHPAATYAIPTEGSSSSEVHVWSDGVRRLDAGGSVVEIGFELENRFDTPLEFAADSVVVLDLDLGNGVPQPRLKAPLVSGGRDVAPGDVATLDLTFALPIGVEPIHVHGFAVSWKVVRPVEFEQHTAFRRQPPPERHRPYYYEATYFPLFHYRSYRGRTFCW